ncbi:MAG: hypothetical protein ACRBFS_01985 [Aureispira sp.]
MLEIPSCNLTTATTNHLADQQTDINRKATYQEKVARAKALWNSKESSIPKKAAFEKIKKELRALAIGKLYCNYCEHGEIYDIEHIFPKSLFPDKTFQAENYLYACKACNTGEKLAKFKIFHPAGSTTVLDITPKGGKNRIYTIPASADSVLINPKVENPMDFLFLNLQRGTFALHPQKTSQRDQLRFEYTIELLNLNQRLHRARKNAVLYFWNLLVRYKEAQSAQSIGELKKVADQYSPVDNFTLENLEKGKQEVFKHIKENIITSTHQTVWKEMQRQQATNSNLTNLKNIFSQLPEALTW